MSAARHSPVCLPLLRFLNFDLDLFAIAGEYFCAGGLGCPVVQAVCLAAV